MKNKVFKSVLEYKKSLGDWHYDPSVQSTDCQYVGRIIDLDFSKIKKKLSNKDSEHSCEIYSEDFKNGKKIPSQLDPYTIAAQKIDFFRKWYTEHNSKYTQWIDNRDELPDEFMEIKKLTKLRFSTIACFKQDPGQATPWHFDVHRAVAEKAKKISDKKENVKRYLLFLEDWHWGHFLQIGNSVLSHWKSGDIYTWNYGMYHLSRNGGIVPKWTCQITGLPTKNSLHFLKNQFEFSIKQ